MRAIDDWEMPALRRPIRMICQRIPDSPLGCGLSMGSVYPGAFGLSSAFGLKQPKKSLAVAQVGGPNRVMSSGSDKKKKRIQIYVPPDVERWLAGLRITPGWAEARVVVAALRAFAELPPTERQKCVSFAGRVLADQEPWGLRPPDLEDLDRELARVLEASGGENRASAG